MGASRLGRIAGLVLVTLAFPFYWLWQEGPRLLHWLLFMPYFGLSGSVFVQGNRKRKGLVDWFSYDSRTQLLITQLTKGKTVTTYTVYGVTPLQYLVLRRLPSSERFRLLFLADNTRAYESVWRWRWDGAYSQGRSRRRR